MAQSKLYSVGKYSLGRLKGRWVVTWREGRTRRRYDLHASTQEEAKRALERFARGQAVVQAGPATTVQAVWDAYIADRELEGRKSVPILKFNWRALRTTFAGLSASKVTKQLCRDYADARRAAGIAEATILTELRRLRTALIWGAANKMIPEAPQVWLPVEPRARERWLTEDEVRSLIDAAVSPHLRLFIILALATAGRKEAILGLTWARVDLDRRLIYLDDPTLDRTSKGRATVPINDMALAALTSAKGASLTPYVIEYAQGRVASIKTAWAATLSRAGIEHATPHDLRRTAASWMVMAGTPIEQVARYLGHSSPRTTWKVYGKFAPDYLRTASEAVSLDLRRRIG